MKINLIPNNYKVVDFYEEIWRDIKGYEGLYEVSNMGRIRSLDRYDNRGCKIKGRIMKTQKDKYGYLLIGLRKNGKQKYYRTHRLVAFAFVDGYFEDACIDHINTVRDDNRAVNLRWCTRKENSNNEITLKHFSEANKGKTFSEETRKKLSEARKGRTFSEKTRKKMSEAQKGKTFSEEHKKKLSEAQKGRTHNEETRKKMSEARKGENNWNFGKHLSEETKKKIGESQWKKVICIETGQVFNSLKEAGEIMGVFPTSISACCRGKQKTARGFHWKYYEDYLREVN